MMLRAISEMAVAISVRSVEVNGSSEARRRPSARAVTTSVSDAIGTRRSPATVGGLLPSPAGLGCPGRLARQEPPQQMQALLEV